MSAQVSQKFCVACGQSIDARAEICPKCGVRQPMAAKGKTKLIAGLLAIFLGGIGIHKFYLGQNTMGIVYLVFFWTGIPVIIGFIEGILLLVMSDADFDAKYNAS